MATTFIPGFETRAKARAAAKRYFAFSNGDKPVENIHFHITENEHGRFHFEGGKPKKA